MRPPGQIMLALLLRAPTRNAQGNEAEAEQGEHAGLGDSHEEILERHTKSGSGKTGQVHKWGNCSRMTIWRNDE